MCVYKYTYIHIYIYIYDVCMCIYTHTHTYKSGYNTPFGSQPLAADKWLGTFLTHQLWERQQDHNPSGKHLTIYSCQFLKLGNNWNWTGKRINEKTVFRVALFPEIITHVACLIDLF